MRYPIHRREFLFLTGAGLAWSVVPAGATGVEAQQEGGLRHALTVFGEPALPPDFSQFAYVNPDAPKGGEISLLPSNWGYNQNPLTYDTFNTFVLRGDAPPFMDLCYASMMVRNLDEPDAVYGLIAEGVEVNGLDYLFHLREGPTFSDGSPITAEDVAFTFTTFKADGHPTLQRILANVDTVTAEGRQRLRLTFTAGTSNRLPPVVATLPIVSKAFYEANDFTEADLTIPVSSGAYTVGDYNPGRFVEYVRRDDYWGADLPAGRGHANFGVIRVDFYRERIAGFEAFKKGDVTFREEFTSKTWATEYNFPAINDGRVVKRVFEDGRPSGAQGYFMNTRREKFADPRVREALAHVFDFEWTNENIFYGLYERTPSFFVGSDMMAEGEPSEAELALLEPFRDQLSEAVFGPAWTPPVTDGTGQDRGPLRTAVALFREAGYELTDGKMVDASGEPFTVEFLYRQQTSERILQPFAQRLELIGITPILRRVDASQYQARLMDYDFDITTRRYAMSPTPSEAVREYFASDAADVPGSNNLAGIKDPVVDALVDKMIGAPTREEMVTAARALDRVLRAGHYWIPQWYKGTHTVAYWDAFGIPDEKPRYALPVATTWWSKSAGTEAEDG